MKVIFIFNLAYKTPFVYELAAKLAQKNIEVVFYDLVSAKKYFPTTGKTVSFSPFFLAKFLLKIKYVRRIFIPLINRATIKNEFKNSDIVNLHFVEKKYAKYAKLIKENCAKFVVTFWGSDLLRVDDHARQQYIPLLEYCDKVSMVRGIQAEFRNYYKQYTHKLETSFFGLSILKEIKNTTNTKVLEFKKKYKLTDDFFYITLGYNGIASQNHLTMIAELTKLSTTMKSKIHLLVPMTYGGSEDYKNSVFKGLNDTGIQYTVFSKYLDKQELAALRCVSMITINIQKTDAFSGSISESIAAKNVVLVGKWLPYDIYDEWKIKIFTIDSSDISSHINDIITNFDAYLKLVENNDEKIYNKLTWDARLPAWEKLLFE